MIPPLHKLKSILLIVLNISLLLPVAGQDKWVQYTTANTGENGLLGGFVRDFMKHPDGSLWIAGSGGLNIYEDGIWQSMTSSDGLLVDDVGDIELDQNGNIWISYGGYFVGVSVYNGESFTHYTTEDGLISDLVHDILVDSEGNVWLATGPFSPGIGGVNKFNGESWLSYSVDQGLPDVAAISIVEKAAGEFLIGTNGNGVFLLANDTVVPFSWEENSTARIGDLHIESSGTIWAATSDKAYKYSTTWQEVDPTPPDQYHTIWSIASDDQGRVYFLTSGGMSVLENDAFTQLDIEDSPILNNPFTVHTIGDSVLVGSEVGMAFFADDKWTNITTNDGGLIGNSVNATFEDDDDNIWFCTQSGISRFDGTSWTSFNETDSGAEILWISSGLQDERGIFWFTSVQGILKFDGNSWEVFDSSVDPMFGGWPQEIIMDSDGNLWFATFDNILMYDGNTWTSYNSSNGFASSTFDALYADSNGRIWFGGRNGISHYQQGQFTHYTNGVDFNTITPIRSFMEDENGNILVLSASDLLSYADGTWETVFGVGLGYEAHIDDSHQLWISILRTGLVKYLPSGSEIYSIEDGLTANVVQDIYRTAEGVFYLSTTGGITEITPEIQVNSITITESQDLQGAYDIAIEDEGLTAPYQFSFDGTTFHRNAGLFEDVSPAACEMLVTNSYDTIRVPLELIKPSAFAATICDDESYQFGSQLLTQPGDYTNIFRAKNGCDSTVTLSLSIAPIYHLDVTASICEGDSFPFGSQVLTQAGSYTEVFPSALGCDSTVFLTFAVNECQVLGTEQGNSYDIQVFPNPTYTVSEIDLGNTLTGTLTVMTIAGQVIRSESFIEKKTMEIDLSGETSGIYVIYVAPADGKIFKTTLIKK